MILERLTFFQILPSQVHRCLLLGYNSEWARSPIPPGHRSHHNSPERRQMEPSEIKCISPMAIQKEASWGRWDPTLNIGARPGRVDLDLGGRIYQLDTVVVSLLTPPAIFGLDFLQEYTASVDFRQKMLHLAHQGVAVKLSSAKEMEEQFARRLEEQQQHNFEIEHRLQEHMNTDAAAIALMTIETDENISQVQLDDPAMGWL